MTKEIHNNRVVILPVVIDRCDIPFFLANKLYADFTNPNIFEKNAEKLLRSILKEKRSLRTGDNSENSLQIGETRNIRYKSTLIPIYLASTLIFLSFFGLIATKYFFEANTYIKNADFIKSNVTVFWLLVIALMFGEIIRVLLALYQIRNDPNFATEAGLVKITSIFFSRYRRVIKKYWHKPLIKVMVYFEIVILIGIIILFKYAYEIVKIALN